MTKGQQSPLRPKRLRHVFRSACNYAGIEDDMVRVFLGQSGMSSKIYLGKSKEELEFFYNLVEPKITVYDEEQRPELQAIQKDYDVLKGELIDVKKGLQAVQTMFGITQMSAAINNKLNQSMKRDLLKRFGEDKLRENIAKSIKEAQDMGMTEEMFSKILRKHTKDKPIG